MMDHISWAIACAACAIGLAIGTHIQDTNIATVISIGLVIVGIVFVVRGEKL